MALYTLATELSARGMEPQRQHNWSVEFNLADAGIVSLSIVNGFLPVGYNDEVPLPYGNAEIFVAGKQRWDAGAIVCRDWVNYNVLGHLLGWRQLVSDTSTGAIGLASFYKRQATIITFAPDVLSGAASRSGLPSRDWTLLGCWPVRVNPAANGLDMTTSGLVMIEMVLRFDRAEPGPTIGVTIPPIFG